MKFSLRNRPKITVTFEDSPHEFTMQVQKLEKHLENFEKELRERKKWLVAGGKSLSDEGKARLKFIKEILEE